MTTRSTLAYPITAQNGRLSLSNDAAIERDAIFSVLETRPYERVMRPLSYGTPDYLFESIGSSSTIPTRVEAALRSQIPNLNDVSVSGSIAETGILSITIYWEDIDDSDTQSVTLAIY